MEASSRAPTSLQVCEAGRPHPIRTPLGGNGQSRFVPEQSAIIEGFGRRWNLRSWRLKKRWFKTSPEKIQLAWERMGNVVWRVRKQPEISHRACVKEDNRTHATSERKSHPQFREWVVVLEAAVWHQAKNLPLACARQGSCHSVASDRFSRTFRWLPEFRHFDRRLPDCLPRTRLGLSIWSSHFETVRRDCSWRFLIEL